MTKMYKLDVLHCINNIKSTKCIVNSLYKIYIKYKTHTVVDKIISSLNKPDILIILYYGNIIPYNEYNVISSNLLYYENIALKEFKELVYNILLFYIISESPMTKWKHNIINKKYNIYQNLYKYHY